MASTTLSALGRTIDEQVASLGESVDLLGATAAAATLLDRLQECESDAPLLNQAAATSLVVVTPSDGLTAAYARVELVLQVLPPYSGHTIERLLDLVAPSARDVPRVALLAGILTLALVGRQSMDARDDNGLAAWKATHLMLAHTLEGAASRGLPHSVPFTHCVQLPIAALRGATLELSEELIEGLAIKTSSRMESKHAALERRRVPLASAIVVVRREAAAVSTDADDAPWAAMSGSATGPSHARLYDDESAHSVSGRRDGGAAQGGARVSGEEMRVRTGDVVVALDDKLLNSSLAKVTLAPTPNLILPWS